MSDADRDKMLREMAANRGLHLVKSRRRTPGVGDYGRYGLKDQAGKEVFGFGKGGLTATADEIETHLRDFMVEDWKSSLKQAAQAPRPEKRPASQAAKEKAPPSPPPPPAPLPPPPAPPRLVIREAKAGDAEAIAGLIRELGFDAEPADVSKRLRVIAKGGEPVLVAEQDGVIGCLTWHVTPVLHRPTPVGRVTMLVVTESARREGVGEKLVAEAEARTAARGCGLIEVTSNIELGGAHEFYRRIGFERTSYRFVKKLEPKQAG
ncbi:MAG TPA: GNAT family N-acetyltransferase [Allosphingosinicella sp.]|jgi:ribosomal protein S18 acetylase RimI-like enzyme|nr:GNAT family N-acetyltransferase [Allosphingosinicella sp.]